jgi:hypothetical protein
MLLGINLRHRQRTCSRHWLIVYFCSIPAKSLAWLNVVQRFALCNTVRSSCLENFPYFSHSLQQKHSKNPRGCGHIVLYLSNVGGWTDCVVFWQHPHKFLMHLLSIRVGCLMRMLIIHTMKNYKTYLMLIMHLSS